MVKSCSVLGCKQRYSKGSGISFHRFPAESQIKDLWIKALARHNWQPSSYSLVCGKHFLTGRPSAEPDHPDFIPNVFPHVALHHKYRASNVKRLLLMSEEVASNQPVLSRFSTIQDDCEASNQHEAATNPSSSNRRGCKHSSDGEKQSTRKRKKIALPRRYIPPPRKAVEDQDSVQKQHSATQQLVSAEGAEGDKSSLENQLLLMQRLSEQNAQVQEEMRTELRKQQSEIKLLQVQVEMLREKNARLSKEPKHTPRDVMSEAFLLDKNQEQRDAVLHQLLDDMEAQRDEYKHWPERMLAKAVSFKSKDFNGPKGLDADLNIFDDGNVIVKIDVPPYVQ
ncbi:hypothetical protein B566_EDAN001086 [Ephemera danica]|nr:hypothetical protein B566_EDAN001086 [Ephemera danica]